MPVVAQDRGGPAQPLLSIRGLSKTFSISGGMFGRGAGQLRAVDRVDFEVLKGETLGVVGESGCGKSTTARVLMQLIGKDDGEILFDGERVGSSALKLKEYRRQVQMVFQDSYSSLNPRLTIEASIAFGPQVHGVPRAEAVARARSLLARVGLEPGRFAERYPHELSGGQRQRVNIARALALEPRLIILDEAVSALDKSVEAQVLNLLLDLKEEFGLTYVFISHDLGVVRFVSDRVMVMYLGQVVEIGEADTLFDRPLHPYTAALLSSMPSLDPDRRTEEAPLAGDPPSPIDPPPGCRFHTRCAYAEPICAEREPALYDGGPLQRAACLMVPPGSGHSRAPAAVGPAMVDAAMAPSPVSRTAEAALASSDPLVRVRGLKVTFATGHHRVRAVDGVDLTLARGEVMALIGESGSGKSVTLRALMRLNPERRTKVEGEITVAGEDVLALGRRRLSQFRGGEVAMIFQEPLLALDPVYRLGDQITEAIRRHESIGRSEARARALALFERVRIPSPERRLDAYPHEMSGGMRQRAMIALALACRPKLLLADEPTTALDATVQIQILLLLRELQRDLGLSVIFVTHDIGAAVEVADRIAVMYAGRIVEEASARDLIRTPRHPYSIGLLKSRAHGALAKGSRLVAIPGAPPDLAALPPGCAFAPRCPLAIDACRAAPPPAIEVGPLHSARCIRTAEAAALAAA